MGGLRFRQLGAEIGLGTLAFSGPALANPPRDTVARAPWFWGALVVTAAGGSASSIAFATERAPGHGDLAPDRAPLEFGF